MVILAPDSSIDLHLHTYASDGVWSPTDLVEALVRLGITIGAVCDHDSQRSVLETIAMGQQRGITIIPGIELTVTYRDRPWHLLVYGIRPDDQRPEAKHFLDIVHHQESELRRLAIDARERILAKGQTLTSLDAWESTSRLTFADGKRPQHVHTDFIDGPLRPIHILRAYIADGHGPSLKEAAERVVELGGQFDSYVPLEEVVAAARKAGGVTVLAHPGRPDLGPVLDEETLRAMLTDGPLDGLECHYRTYSDATTTEYRELADRHGLVKGTGSDSHGPGVPVYPRPYRAAWARELLGRLGVDVDTVDGPDWSGHDPLNVQ